MFSGPYGLGSKTNARSGLIAKEQNPAESARSRVSKKRTGEFQFVRGTARPMSLRARICNNCRAKVLERGGMV